MITQPNYIKENLNPFNIGIKEGISLITAIKNRQDTFEQALQTWVTHDEIDEIIIVDWDSDESLVSLVQKYQNGKIFLAIVKDQPKWVLSFAYNLAARLSSRDKLLKVDSDIKLLPDFFDHHTLTPGIFFTGNWEIARNDNERHLNGTMFITRFDFFAVNGYNEFIQSYGWDDSDLYLRIESKGTERKNFNPDDIYHIQHENRTFYQDRTNFINGLDDKERTILNILINKYLCQTIPDWAEGQLMLDFNITFIDSFIFQCVANHGGAKVVSHEISLYCERLALIERLSHFNLSYDPNIVTTLNRDELIAIYTLYLSKEENVQNGNLLSVFTKFNELIVKKNISQNDSFIHLLPEISHNPAYPKITIVTPNFNGGKFLEETILSVTCQNYPNLEYIVIDGGSTDNSLAIIKKYSKYFTYWESKPDNGLYHSLQKGFEKSSGEIMGWINSDDILQKNSLFALQEIFLSNQNILWLQGYPIVIDEMSRMVYHRPQVHSKFFFYLKEYHDGRFIQQESTFWHRTLWNKAGGHISMQYQYAGDFELWMRFFKHEQLYITNTMLGAFRMRKDGQISTRNYHNYLLECDQIIDAAIISLTNQEKKILQNMRRRKYYQRRYPKLSRFFPSSYPSNDTGSKIMVNFDLNEHKY